MSRPLRLALLAGLLLARAGAAGAEGFAASARQGQLLMSAGWEASLPRRGLSDFVDRTGYRGFEVEARYAPRRFLSLGLAGGWSWLAQERGQGSLALADAVISGNLYRRVQLSALRLTGHAYLWGGALQPYLGGAGGPVWSQEYEQVGEVVRRQSSVHLAWGPQAGLLWTVRPGLALQLQGSWLFSNARFGSPRRAEWLAVRLGLAAY